MTTALIALSFFCSSCFCSSAVAQEEPMGWTGLLDEAAFAALHQLKEGDAPVLLGKDLRIGTDAGYLSLPPVGAPIGGVVVIHEWWGLNDHIKHWADRLAADGYAALAVDLYGGTVATTREDAMQAMQSVDTAQAVATLRAAHRFLREDPRTHVERTAGIGWCFGGGMSLQLAMAEPELDAAIVYYGRLVTDPDALHGIQAPLLGVFGNRDTGIPPASVAEFATAMQNAGKTLTLAQYDADHAFANPSSARYDATHAADAWERSRAFLAEHLMPALGAGLYSAGTRTLEAWAPEGWTAEEGRAMRLKSYKIGASSECSIIALRGNGGGLKPNLARWSAQMGAEPLDDAAFDRLPRIPMLGTLAITVQIDGHFTDMSGASIDDASLLGTVCELEGETVFVKLVGPRAEVEAERENFSAFCHCLR